MVNLIREFLATFCFIVTFSFIKAEPFGSIDEYKVTLERSQQTERKETGRMRLKDGIE